METVDHKIHKPEYEQRPYRIQQHNAAATLFIDIGDHITCPGQHRKKHENKIKYRIGIEDGKQLTYIVMFVQDPPCDIRNKIQYRRYEKMPVADRHPPDCLLPFRHGTVLP
jgi:hypothetical protein